MRDSLRSDVDELRGAVETPTAHMFGIVLHFAILWFLITLFTRQTNAAQSTREAKIVYIAMGFVWLVTRLLLWVLMGPLVIAIEAVALYLLVDKVCETPKRITMRICIWYIVLAACVYGIFFLLEVMLNG